MDPTLDDPGSSGQMLGSLGYNQPQYTYLIYK